MGTDRSLNVWRSRYVRCEERMLVATSLYHLDLSENLGRSIVAARRHPPPPPVTALFDLPQCSGCGCVLFVPMGMLGAGSAEGL